MDFNNYSFGKIDYKKIFKTGTFVVGVILLFISIFIPYPIFIYTATIGAILISIHFIITHPPRLVKTGTPDPSKFTRG